jgi:small-conductance mechanosensitive channel
MPARQQLMAQGEGQGWRLWLIGSVVATGFHLWALYRPAGPSVSWLPNADKLGHAVIFGLPLLLILITVASRRRALGRRLTGRFVWIAAAVFAGHAVLSEWIQRRFYSERVGDPYDVVADCTGCALALLGYAWVDRRWTAHVEAGQA